MHHEVLALFHYAISSLACEFLLPLQPSGPKPNVIGVQVSQHRPITLGLHSQIPPSLLQDGPREPTTLHLHAEDRQH